jgi:hypothetical protein
LSEESGIDLTEQQTGIAAVRGEYLAFFDSEDIWGPWKLDLAIACFEAGLASHCGTEICSCHSMRRDLEANQVAFRTRLTNICLHSQRTKQ